MIRESYCPINWTLTYKVNYGTLVIGKEDVQLMKGYTIQHSIELLERQAGSGSGGASTAAQVSFDNTGTGLVATNVQGALTEINSKPTEIYSATETLIGKWLNEDLYRRVYDLESDLAISPSAFVSTTIDATAMKNLINVRGIYSTGATSYPLLGTIADGVVKLQSERNGESGASCRYIIVEYTKIASNSKSRSKK